MTKKDFELSFPSITDFLLKENNDNKFSFLSIADLPNIQFDRNNIDKVLIKMNLESTLLVGLYFTDDIKTEIYFFEGVPCNADYNSDVKVYFSERVELFSELEQLWQTRINKNFPNI